MKVRRVGNVGAASWLLTLFMLTAFVTLVWRLAGIEVSHLRMRDLGKGRCCDGYVCGPATDARFRQRCDPGEPNRAGVTELFSASGQPRIQWRPAPAGRLAGIPAYERYGVDSP
jgi:hypothetical protein